MVRNKQIKDIYLGFSGKISSKFQLHDAVSAEDKCFTIYHSSLLHKEQGSDVFRLYKPAQTGTLSLVFAHIKYKETYGVTTTFKYNNDCDNAAGTELAFCYTREKKTPDFQWTSTRMTDTTFIAPKEKKKQQKCQQQKALIELILAEKQLTELHEILKPFGCHSCGVHTYAPSWFWYLLEGNRHRNHSVYKSLPVSRTVMVSNPALPSPWSQTSADTLAHCPWLSTSAQNMPAHSPTAWLMGGKLLRAGTLMRLFAWRDPQHWQMGSINREQHWGWLCLLF